MNNIVVRSQIFCKSSTTVLFASLQSVYGKIFYQASDLQFETGTQCALSILAKIEEIRRNHNQAYSSRKSYQTCCNAMSQLFFRLKKAGWLSFCEDYQYLNDRTAETHSRCRELTDVSLPYAKQRSSGP